MISSLLFTREVQSVSSDQVSFTTLCAAIVQKGSESSVQLRGYMTIGKLQDLQAGYPGH